MRYLCLFPEPCPTARLDRACSPIVFFLCLLCALPAVARTGDAAADWRPVGPFVGDVRTVATVPGLPGRLLAGTVPERSGAFSGVIPGNLYLSDDDGHSWQRHASPGVSGSIYDIEALGAGQTVWISGSTGIQRSDDGGNTFSRVPGFRRVFDISVDPLDPSRIWLAGSSTAQSPVLELSDDGGLSFADRSPPGDWPCFSTAVEGMNVAVVCRESESASADAKLWISADLGQTWTDRTLGLPESRLRVTRRQGGTLLVGAGSGLFASGDDGRSWDPLHDESWPLRSVHTVLPLPGGRLLVGTDGGGLFESTDGGASWTFGVGASDGWSVRAIAAVDGEVSRVFLGLRDLALVRRAGAEPFAVSHEGISDLVIHDIAIYGPNPDVIALATELDGGRGGIYTSTGGTPTSESAQWQLETAPRGTYVAVSHGADGTLFALATQPLSQAGVWRRDPDASWHFVGPSLSPVPTWAGLSVTGGDTHRLVIGGRVTSPEGSRAVLHRSTDGGAGWSQVYESEGSNNVISAVDVLALGDDTLLAVVDDLGAPPQHDRVLRSSDGGESWHSADTGLPTELAIRGLCASAAAPSEPFLHTHGDEHAVFRSTDDGLGWWSLGPPADLTHLTCDPQVPQTLYATRFTNTERGVVLSANGGADFSTLPEGAQVPNRAGLDLELRPIPGPARQHELLLGTYGIGLWALRLPRRVLFSDGFESGDLGRWSLAQPEHPIQD